MQTVKMSFLNDIYWRLGGRSGDKGRREIKLMIKQSTDEKAEMNGSWEEEIKMGR